MKYKIETRQIDNLLNSVLDENISSCAFIEFVRQHWSLRRFVLRSSDTDALNKRIVHRAGHSVTTIHGRHKQPIYTSQHLLGSEQTVAARLTFDLPTNEDRPEAIEFHIHPVSSIILIIQGNGEFLVQYSSKGITRIIRVPLTPGIVVCFPAFVVHSMKVTGVGIQALNMTSRRNQPPYREGYQEARSQKFRLLPPSSGFSTPVSIPDGIDRVDYFEAIQSDS